MLQNYGLSLKIFHFLLFLTICFWENPSEAKQASDGSDTQREANSTTSDSSENMPDNNTLSDLSNPLSEFSECCRIGSPTIVFFRGHSFKPVQYSFVHEHSVLGLGYSTSTYPLIWYPTVKDSQSEPLKLTWDEASQFCQNHQARLPSRREIKILLGHIGFQSSQEALAAHSNQQMVPVLESEFWSSTEFYGNGKIEVYFYNPMNQRMSLTPQLNDSKSFRCVTDLTVEN